MIALNLAWLNLARYLKLFSFSVLSGKGLELRTALQLRAQRSKRAPFYVRFSLFMGEEGGLLTKRRPFLSQALSNPTARSRWRHCFALRAKRRWVCINLVLKFDQVKFNVFKMRVSVCKI